MSSANIYRIAVMAAVIVGGLAPVGRAGASTEPLAEPVAIEQHCVVEVTGVQDGAFVTQPEVCFAVEADAAAHAASIGAAQPGKDQLTRSSGDNTIGIHYTSTYYSGSSVRVVGTTCGGGVWYPTGAWNNNIESSRHFCGSSPTTFYNYSSCTGPLLSIYRSESTLGSMNNRASCMRYG